MSLDSLVWKPNTILDGSPEIRWHPSARTKCLSALATTSFIRSQVDATGVAYSPSLKGESCTGGQFVAFLGFE